MKYACLALCFALSIPVSAQRLAHLDSIEANNTTLRALRAQTEAETAQNRAEVRLPDPEAEVAYLWGRPQGMPGRVNVGVTQPLDWGVLTGRRKKVAKAADGVSQSKYFQQRQTILAEALQTLTQVIYYNRLCAELEHRIKLAEEVKQLYTEKYEQGDINQVEMNKVRLNATVASAALHRAESERHAQLLNLKRLNGGEWLECKDTVYAKGEIPALAYVQNRIVKTHPSLTGATAAIEHSEQQLRLTKAQGWPQFSVGFTGEYVGDTKYNGLKLGLSIPLWGNTRSKVRQGKAELAARKLDLSDARTQLLANVQQQYATAVKLQQTARNLQNELAATSNADLLRRSLEEGQLSLLDYLLELSFYYDARTAQLEAERDANLAIAAYSSYLL